MQAFDYIQHRIELGKFCIEISKLLYHEGNDGTGAFLNFTLGLLYFSMIPFVPGLFEEYVIQVLYLGYPLIPKMEKENHEFVCPTCRVSVCSHCHADPCQCELLSLEFCQVCGNYFSDCECPAGFNAGDGV